MKYAVALEGGGSKGAYHAGALRALRELNIEIEAITGTSIGSINGAYYIQDGDLKLTEFWNNIKPEQLIPDYLETFKNSLVTWEIEDYKALLKEIRMTIHERGLDLSNYKRTLYDFIDEEKVRASVIDFGLVTYSLTDMKPVEVMIKDIPEGKLIEFLIASSYLPGFKREKLSGKSFIDGAFHDNLPVNLLIDNGYKKIIAIELLGMGLKQKVKDKTAEVISIRPSDDLGKVLDFRKDKSKSNILMGYYDTLRVFKYFYGNWYYLKDIWSPEEAFEFFDALTKDEVFGLAEILNIKRIPHKRCLFERIIPKLMELIDIPEVADYNMVLLYILEYVAKLLSINRYQLITMEELITLITNHLLHFKNEHQDWNDSIIKLLKSTGLYTQTFKDQVVMGCVGLIMAGNKQGGRNGL